jgi:hypothetical protein
VIPEVTYEQALALARDIVGEGPELPPLPPEEFEDEVSLAQQQVKPHLAKRGDKIVPIAGYTRTVLSFTDADEADRWARDWQGAFADEHRSAALDSSGQSLVDYSTTSFRWVNGYLRGPEALQHQVDDWNEGEGYEDVKIGWARSRGKKVSAKVDELMEQAPPLPQDVTVYRGAKPQTPLKVGDTFTDDAYVSTSMTADRAEDFRSMYDEENPGELFEIVVPKGTKAIYVDAFRTSCCSAGA